MTETKTNMDRLNFDWSGGIAVAAGAASASGTLPQNSAGKNNTYYVACTGQAHVRIGIGAQTAVATDPLVQNSMPLIIVAPTGADTIACIQEGSASTVVVSRVMEG